MLKESDIIYQQGDYWAIKTSKGFEVYKDNSTHAVRCAIIGFKGDEGLNRVKQEINKRNDEHLVNQVRHLFD